MEMQDSTRGTEQKGERRGWGRGNGGVERWEKRERGRRGRERKGRGKEGREDGRGKRMMGEG